MEFVFLTILVLQLFILFNIVKDIINPLIILRISWIVSMVFVIIYKDSWGVSISLNTIILFLIGFAFFDMGYFSMVLVKSVITTKYGDEFVEFKINERNSYIVLFSIIIFSTILVYLSLSLVGSYQGFSNFLVQLRYLMKRTETNTSLVQFGNRIIESVGISYILIYFLDTSKRFRQKLLYSSIITISLLMIILSTGRYRFLSIIVMILYVYINVKRREGMFLNFKGQLRLIKISTISLFSFLILFNTFGSFFFQKASDDILATFAIYFSGGIVAFENTWESISNSSTIFGEALLAPIYSLIENLLPIEIYNTTVGVLPTVYANNNFASNIYTFFRQQVVDFGVLGVVIAMYSIGTLISFLKIKSENEEVIGFWTLVYAYFMFGIVTSTFQDIFFTNSTFHIFSIATFYLITKTNLVIKNLN